VKRFDAKPARLTFSIQDAAKRQINMRVWEWNAPGESDTGPVLLAPGSFADTKIEANVLRMDHQDPPIGQMVSFSEDETGADAVYHVSATPRGDEAIQLISDGIYRGASVAFMAADPKPARTEDGRTAERYEHVDWLETSLTWRPAHPATAILSVHHKQHGDPSVAEIQDENKDRPEIRAVENVTKADLEMALSTLADRFAEGQRQIIDLPDGMTLQVKRKLDMGRWASFALRLIDGENISTAELHQYALADVISTGNAGAVPPAFREDLRLGFIDRARPFLQSTREVPAGSSGLAFTIPRLGTKPLAGKQTAEKAELPSRATTIDTVQYSMETYGGAADLSLQLIKRSSPEFLTLFLELLAEAYAQATEDAAVDKLLAEAAVVEGGIFNVASPSFGGAITNAMAVNKALLPDRIWLSTAAVAAFVDAKEPAGGGGTALYPGLALITGVTEGGGSGPLGMRLTPVHVPALDDEAPDLIIGPSRGFVWCEDGTYTLVADVPAKFGRDVALAGMIAYMPLYPAAFTSYTLS
jgi:phage head maturation protease